MSLLYHRSNKLTFLTRANNDPLVWQRWCLYSTVLHSSVPLPLPVAKETNVRNEITDKLIPALLLGVKGEPLRIWSTFLPWSTLSLMLYLVSTSHGFKEEKEWLAWASIMVYWLYAITNTQLSTEVPEPAKGLRNYTENYENKNSTSSWFALLPDCRDMTIM